VKKLLLAAGAIVTFAGAASATPAESPTVGPSYNCMAPTVQKQPLAQLICANPAVSRAELSYVIAFTALRQISDDAARQTMHAEAEAFTHRTTAECGLPATGYLGGRAPTSQETNCLLAHFDQERGRLLNRLSGDAMDEAQLSPEKTVAIQRALKEKGFLAAKEAIDGVFGPATRAAIGDWQRSVGQPATGFGSTVMLDQLQSTPQAPAAYAPTTPPQAPAAAPTATSTPPPATPAPSATPAIAQAKPVAWTPPPVRWTPDAIQAKQTVMSSLDRTMRHNHYTPKEALGLDVANVVSMEWTCEQLKPDMLDFNMKDNWERKLYQDKHNEYAECVNHNEAERVGINEWAAAHGVTLIWVEEKPTRHTAKY